MAFHWFLLECPVQLVSIKMLTEVMLSIQKCIAIASRTQIQEYSPMFPRKPKRHKIDVEKRRKLIPYPL